MDSVPLASIPELMCALGYYPAQSAVTDMISSLAYMAAMKKEPKPSSVSLERLLFLFYNFSPVCGVWHIFSLNESEILWMYHLIQR